VHAWVSGLDLDKFIHVQLSFERGEKLHFEFIRKNLAHEEPFVIDYKSRMLLSLTDS
jgi:hypothetical protein